MSALAYRIETVIRRAPEDVFDYCSELQWNPKVKYVEKLTGGPVGVGTRYRARWANSGPTTVEMVGFDRPRRWETNATARGMGIRFQGTVTDAALGAGYTASLELQPGAWPGWLRPLPSWSCDAKTRSTCTSSGRRPRPARLRRPGRPPRLTGSAERISRTAQSSPSKDGVDTAGC